MENGTIDLVSTSLKTADASPIVLNKTDIIQTKFDPVLVENDKEPAKCVSGKLIQALHMKCFARNVLLSSEKSEALIQCR
jgi:hypothetical protein